MLEFLGDGSTTVKPFDFGYAARMAQSLGIEGTGRRAIDMFGIGCWGDMIRKRRRKPLTGAVLRRRTTAGTTTASPLRST